MKSFRSDPEMLKEIAAIQKRLRAKRIKATMTDVLKLAVHELWIKECKGEKTP